MEELWLLCGACHWIGIGKETADPKVSMNYCPGCGSWGQLGTYDGPREISVPVDWLSNAQTLLGCGAFMAGNAEFQGEFLHRQRTGSAIACRQIKERLRGAIPQLAAMPEKQSQDAISLELAAYAKKLAALPNLLWDLGIDVLRIVPLSLGESSGGAFLDEFCEELSYANGDENWYRRIGFPETIHQRLFGEYDSEGVREILMAAGGYIIVLHAQILKRLGEKSYSSTGEWTEQYLYVSDLTQVYQSLDALIESPDFMAVIRREPREAASETV